MKNKRKILKKVALSAASLTIVALPVSCTITVKIDNGLNDAIKQMEEYLNSKEVKEFLKNDIKELPYYSKVNEIIYDINSEMSVFKQIPATANIDSSNFVQKLSDSKVELRELIKKANKTRTSLIDEDGKEIDLNEIVKNLNKSIVVFQKQLVDDDEQYEQIKNGSISRPVPLDEENAKGELPWKMVDGSQKEIPYSDLEKHEDKFYSSEFLWENSRKIEYKFYKTNDEKVNIQYLFPYSVIKNSEPTTLEEEYKSGGINERIKINDIKLQAKFEDGKVPKYLDSKPGEVYTGELVSIKVFDSKEEIEKYKCYVVYSFTIKTKSGTTPVNLLFDFPIEIFKDYEE